MLPDWVSNPGPVTYESGALPIALHGPACQDPTGNYYALFNNKLAICYAAKRVARYQDR